MDLWVVAAAAGASYLVRFWNRNLKNSDSSSQLSSEDANFENPVTSSHSSYREVRREKLGKDFSSEQRVFDENPTEGISMDGLSTMEITSNEVLHSEKIRSFGMHDDSIVLSISNLPLSLSPNGNLNDAEGGIEQIYDAGGNYDLRSPDSSAREVGPNDRSAGSKTSLKTKNLHGRLCRPLNSLESCLMAQLYKEHSEVEEYVLNSLPPPPTPTRSFLVSNGSRIIRSNHNSFSTLIRKDEHKWCEEAYQDHAGSIFGIPSLPKVGCLNDHKKLKHKAGKLWSERLSASGRSVSRKHIHAQLDVTFLFSLGLSFGIILSIMTNKRESDKLRDLLKQTENLVQDLQEEIEMKDSMTVKELSNENYSLQDAYDHSSYHREPNGFSCEKHMDNSLRDDCKELYNQEEEENSEPMSKIEAELEAELERLGLNMNTSSLERKLSELVEVDPDFIADFAQGEFRDDKVKGKAFPPRKSDESTSDAVTPLPGNYAVSPHELSLRLHEVIESRLEERVKELENALQNSQRKVQLMETEHKQCNLRNFSNYSQASPFGGGNPLTYDVCDPMAQPLVMNLSGEALDAYSEAYEELIKTDESEQNSPSGIHDYQGLFGILHGGTNGPVTFFPGNGEKFLEFSSRQSSDVCELNDVTTDENCGSDNEIERQVIREIVDRTKRGSPAFKNVQKLLYSMGEDERLYLI